jgi:hypothetical protein
MGRLGVTVALIATGASVVALIVATISAGSHLAASTPTGAGAQVRVTRDFGSIAVASGSLAKAPTNISVLNFTQRFAKVTASAGTVTAIDGHANAGKTDWSYYVNGIAANKGSRATVLHPGDHVWWDLHDPGPISSIGAVVGAYPEPFTNGAGGQRYPTVLTCASGLTTACDTVTKSLDNAGVKVSFQGLGTGSGSDSLAVLVGTFSQLQGVIASELLQAGPAQSGVFAQYVGTHGQVLELDDAAGDVAATMRSSVGLIAATEQEGLNEPVWLVTGTDTAGVDAAAKALTAAKLAGHFAVAVLPSGKLISLPVPASF